MENKKIYIIQMDSHTIPSRAIKWITRYKYSHICISLEKQCNKVYSFGRRTLHNFLNGGFVTENKDGKFFSKFNKTICRIYEIEVSNSQYEELKRQLNYMEENKYMYKYDYLGIFLRYFNIPITFENHYVCSNFVAKLLEKYGIYYFKKPTCLVRPKDFELIENKKEIYSGSYLKYI